MDGLNSAAGAVEGVIEKHRIGGDLCAELRRTGTELLQHQRQHQGAGIVVRAIALGEIRHREARMLKDAG